MKWWNIAVAAALVCVSAVALAQPKPTVAVLGLEVIDDGRGLDEATVAFSRSLTEELRHRAQIGKGPYALAPNSNKDLLELKLLSNCADEARACMAEIGQELGADRLLYGKVEKRADGFQVSLKLLNAESGAMERTMSDIVPFEAVRDDDTRAVARAFYNRLTGIPETGAIELRANVDKGTVYVDGEVATTLSAGSATVSGLAQGAHTLAVETRGYQRYEGRVTVSAGETREVSVSLLALGGPSGDHDERPGGASRVLFWTSLVATGAGVTAFAITGIQMRSLEDDKDDEFNALVENGADISGHATVDNCDPTDETAACVFVDVCAIARDNRGVAGAQDLIETCNDGRKRATLSNVFLGTSIATALLASYFYYRGYIAPDDERERAPGRAGNAVRFAPAIGPNVVGAGLEIEF